MSGQVNYIRRKIDVTFQMTSNFKAGSYNQSQLSGLRVSATITEMGAPSSASLQMRVFGLALSRMNDLTTISWLPNYNLNNKVTVMAGDDDTGMWQVYSGTITTAFMEGSGQPEVSFFVESVSGTAERLKPGPPITTEDQTDVAQQMQSLADAMGYKFENNGVNLQLHQSYVPRTLLDQAHALAEHANIQLYLDPTNNTLAIWPKDKPRTAANTGGSIPLISRDTGMHDYPVFNQTFIMVTTAYNPELVFGGQFQLDTEIEPAKGTYIITALTHTLESEMPGGRWVSTVQGTRNKGTGGS